MPPTFSRCKTFFRWADFLRLQDFLQMGKLSDAMLDAICCSAGRLGGLGILDVMVGAVFVRLDALVGCVFFEEWASRCELDFSALPA